MAKTGPSPDLIFSFLTAYQNSAVLKGAIELDFFAAIAEGNTTATAIAKYCKASVRGVRILADYLTVMGLVSKKDDVYGLTPDTSMFLNSQSPAYIGAASRFLMSEELVSAFRDIAGAVRKGGTVRPDQGTVSVENPVWVDFARGMASVMMPAAQALAEFVDQSGPLNVLDVAAGHGLFGIMTAAKNPAAEIVALDWSRVLDVAEENARQIGVETRWKRLSGDAMSVDYGRDYDVVFLVNFLHHFDPPGCETILRKTHSALKPGGRAVTLDFVPNEDRVSPPHAASFSMVMLATTPGGDAYTFVEFDRMFKNAGFNRSELHMLPNLPQQVIVSYA